MKKFFSYAFGSCVQVKNNDIRFACISATMFAAQRRRKRKGGDRNDVERFEKKQNEIW